jgi:HSP20 family protein
MSNITRFDPFNDITRFDPFLNVNDYFKGLSMRPFITNLDYEPKMKLDVTESEGSFLVKAEIPGVNKDDIHISVDGNMVSISAELKKEKDVKKDEKIICSERYFGQVARSFSLDSDVNAEKVQAKYMNGVLEVTLPKKSNGSKKTITVS